MNRRAILAALCAVVLAASHTGQGWIGWAAAAFGLAGACSGVALAGRHPQVGPWLAILSIAALAVWPNPWAANAPAVAWMLGLACAAGILAAAPAGAPPPDRVQVGQWLALRLPTLALLATLVMAMAAAPWFVRRMGGPAYAQGWEWQGPYGTALAAFPLLAVGAATVAILLARSSALRRRRDA